ncbi:hypothetical protein MBLNU230_g4266t1 [Neophaeotheca triangularis]
MPVELAANAIGLAAFGLHVVDILNKYLSSFKNAEKRMNAILYDTKLITAVLQQFKEHVDEESEVHMSREARDIAEDAFDRCSNVFKDIYTALVDGEPPSPSVDGSFRSHDVSKISFRKRIGWHFLEPKLELHRTNLDRIKTTLQLLTSVTTWGVLRKLCPDVSKVVNQKEKEIAALTEAARTAVKRADDLEKEHEAQQRKVLQNTKADSEAQGGIKPDTPPYERAGSSMAVLSRTYSAQGNDVTPSKIPHLLHGEAKAATRDNKASASICSSTGKGLQKRPSPGDTRSPFHVMMVKPPFSRGSGLTVSAHPQNQDQKSGALVSTAENPTLDAPNLRDGGSPSSSRSLMNLTPSTPGSTTEDSSIRETEPRNIHKPTQCENNALEDDPVLKTILNSLRDQYASKLDISESLKSVFETALFKIYTCRSSGDEPKRTWTTRLPGLSLSDIARAIDLADTQAEKLVEYITAASTSKGLYREALNQYIGNDGISHAAVASNVTPPPAQQAPLVAPVAPEEYYYYARNARDVDRRDDPRDSVSSKGYESDDSYEYIRRERYVDGASRSRSRSIHGHSKRNFAAGALTGAAVFNDPRNRQGQPTRGRGGEALKGAAVGALGAEVILRSKSWRRGGSRSRSRSSDFDTRRSRRPCRSRSRSRTRSESNTRLKQLGGASAVAAVGALAGFALKNRSNDQQQLGQAVVRDRRSMSRRRRTSVRRGSSLSATNISEDCNHTAQEPKHREGKEVARGQSRTGDRLRMRSRSTPGDTALKVRHPHRRMPRVGQASAADVEWSTLRPAREEVWSPMRGDSDDTKVTEPIIAAQRAPSALTREPDVICQGNNDEESEEVEKGEEKDDETRRKEELRERMAKISGGMGTGVLFDVPYRSTTQGSTARKEAPGIFMSGSSGQAPPPSSARELPAESRPIPPPSFEAVRNNVLETPHNPLEGSAEQLLARLTDFYR